MILRRIPYFDCIRYAFCILLIEHALNAVWKNANYTSIKSKTQ